MDYVLSAAERQWVGESNAASSGETWIMSLASVANKADGSR